MASGKPTLHKPIKVSQQLIQQFTNNIHLNEIQFEMNEKKQRVALGSGALCSVFKGQLKSSTVAVKVSPFNERSNQVVFVSKQQKQKNIISDNETSIFRMK